MGFFKSKQDKEIEQRMVIKKTVRELQKHVAKLQIQKNKYIESARQARLQGSNQLFNLAVSGLKFALAQEKKAKEMVLSFEVYSQLNDMGKMTGQFLNGMSLLSKEMKELTDSMDFAKVQKQFEAAMQGMERANDNLDVMLEQSGDSFSDMSSSGFKVEDGEIDALIGSQTPAENAGDLNARIDGMLKELEKPDRL